MITADELLQSAAGMAKRNYIYNRKLADPVGLINGQGKCSVSDHRLGLRRVKGNGCAAIAVYNALTYCGKNPDFDTICLGLEKYALRMGGILGVHPEKIGIFFEKCRIPAIKAEDHTDFINVMKAMTTGVMCYWVAKPDRSLLHFIAVINNRDGTYSLCNRYSNVGKPYAARSLEKFCTKERFVCGYFIN